MARAATDKQKSPSLSTTALPKAIYNIYNIFTLLRR